jgi:hypothetical protein
VKPHITVIQRHLLWGRDLMSIDMLAALDTAPVKVIAETTPAIGAWFETALTVTFAAATVLFVSFVAVVAGLV